jgi:hypothetical protein
MRDEELTRSNALRWNAKWRLCLLKLAAEPLGQDSQAEPGNQIRRSLETRSKNFYSLLNGETHHG